MMAARDAMCTSNAIYNYEFSWLINNFSTMPRVFQGPSISQVPGFRKNLCFELNISGPHPHPTTNKSRKYKTILTLNLVDLDGVGSFRLTSNNTSFTDTNGQILIESTLSNIEFDGQMMLMENSYHTPTPDRPALLKSMKLVDDKLVVKGSLSFTAYDVSSSVSSLIVRPEVHGEISRDFKTMYESAVLSDFTFSLGERTLRAHKVILRSRSPVFATMFDNDMSENNTNQVPIHDSDFHVFNCFLVFLYTGIVEDKTWTTVLGLYYLAHKYQVTSLHAICSGILGNDMTTDSFCSVLELSDLHEDKDLKEVVKVFILCHWKQIVGTTEWAEIVKTKPQLVAEVLSETNASV